VAHKGFFDSIKESYIDSGTREQLKGKPNIKNHGQMSDWLVGTLSKYLHNQHVVDLRSFLVHVHIMHQESHKALGPIVMADKDWGDNELLLKVLYTGCYIVQAAFLHCVINDPDLVTEARWQELRSKMIEHMGTSVPENVAEAESARGQVLRQWDRRYGSKSKRSDADDMGFKVNFGKRRKKS